MERESVPAALTKDKKRIHDEEVAVHLAWQSTLYVTNFPESTDDEFIRTLFGKVSGLESANQTCDLYVSSTVWGIIRRQMAKQEVQKFKTLLLRAICLHCESSRILHLEYTLNHAVGQCKSSS